MGALVRTAPRVTLTGTLRAQALTRTAAALRRMRPLVLGRRLAGYAVTCSAVEDSTFIPRKEGVTDGPWRRSDMEAVTEAMEDSKKRVEKNIMKLRPGVSDILLGKSLEELKVFAEERGQQKFRAQQLHDAVVKNGIKDVSEFSNLSKAWREQLSAEGVITGRSKVYHTAKSPDGTTKLLLELYDGRVVETVGIPLDEDAGKSSRLTVCVSSQVGCPMRCTFCATGKGGFARNLMPYEIIDQVLHIEEHFGTRVSNVVFMGMGEPLLNLPAVMVAHDFMNKELKIGARHITISTVGVPNAILRMAEYNTQSTLAISLHAPSQEIRESIVPSAKAYPIEAIMADAQEYFKRTGRRVSFEYTLLAEINDSLDQARALGRLIKRYDMAAHVNLIPWNPVDESEFIRPSRNGVFRFKKVLEDMNISTSVRSTRGLDAAAACGQLRNSFQKQPLPSVVE